MAAQCLRRPAIGWINTGSLEETADPKVPPARAKPNPRRANRLPTPSPPVGHPHAQTLAKQPQVGRDLQEQSMGWLICRLFHRGFHFEKVVEAASGARIAYAKCDVCGRLHGAKIPTA